MIRSRTGGIPASPRIPVPWRTRISTVSAWSSAVWPSAMRAAPTRSAHAVRAAASRDPRRSTVTVATSTGTPSRWPSRRTASASRAESARSPWSTWSAWSRRLHAGASAASECRSATESAPPDTATKTHSPPASIAWRRMVRSTRSSKVTTLPPLETHPDLAVLEVLLLPDGHRALERVDRVLARRERLRAMRRRHRDEHARLADLEPADAVEHRHAPHPGPAGAEPLADLVHLRLRHRRVRFVLEELHGSPLRLVPHDAGEDDDAAGARILDRGGDRVGRERCEDDPVGVAARAAAHRREEAELVVGAEPVGGSHVLVADREQRERAVTGELGVALGHGRPRRLDGPSLGKLELDPLSPHD